MVGFQPLILPNERGVVDAEYITPASFVSTLFLLLFELGPLHARARQQHCLRECFGHSIDCRVSQIPQSIARPGF